MNEPTDIQAKQAFVKLADQEMEFAINACVALVQRLDARYAAVAKPENADIVRHLHAAALLGFARFASATAAQDHVFLEHHAGAVFENLRQKLIEGNRRAHELDLGPAISRAKKEPR